ncbi:unnamed protein product [Phaeothamnion confervicola]
MKKKMLPLCNAAARRLFRRRLCATAATAWSRPLSSFVVQGSLLEARRAGDLVPRAGQTLLVVHSFDGHSVGAFAALAGDNNPIHLDEQFALAEFSGRIVHGMLVASLFATLFGRTIPKSLYVSQTLRFSEVVLVGEPVTAVIEVQRVRVVRRGGGSGGEEAEAFVRCSTVARRADGAVAVSGKAVVLVPCGGDGGTSASSLDSDKTYVQRERDCAQ